MTDRDLIINNFVDKYYDIGNVVSNDFSPFNITSKEDWSENTFKRGDENYRGPASLIKYVCGIYSDFITDEGISISDMISDWYKVKYDEIVKDVMTYLNGRVTIELGTRNWVTIADGKPWMWKELIVMFNEQYDEGTIKWIYDRWYQDELIEVSEKAMNEPYW